jgi:hypothetical protein
MAALGPFGANGGLNIQPAATHNTTIRGYRFGSIGYLVWARMAEEGRKGEAG